MSAMTTVFVDTSVLIAAENIAGDALYAATLNWLDWLRPAESVCLLSAPVRAIVRFTYYTYPPSFHHRLRRRLYRAPGQAVTVAPPAVAAFCGYVKYVVEVW